MPSESHTLPCRCPDPLQRGPLPCPVRIHTPPPRGFPDPSPLPTSQLGALIPPTEFPYCIPIECPYNPQCVPIQSLMSTRPLSSEGP